jgi:membrane protease subunit HflK
VDEVLTIGRGEIGNSIMERLSKVVSTLGLGVTIDEIQLTNVHPPGPVQSSFGEVNRAQQEREELINKANGEYNKVIPKARGTAEQRISAAEGYALQRVNEAEGDVARFSELLTQYEKAPEVTRQRLYLETMEKVLPRMDRKIIIDEDARQILPLLNLK